jgi:DNA-directed RNA polymerase II subunit RPB2
MRLIYQESEGHKRERDCLISHGSSSMLLDRLLNCSDKFTCAVCRKCGLIAESLAADSPVIIGGVRDYCRNCKLSGPVNIAHVTIPYAWSLFVREVSGLNIAMRMRLKDVPNEMI